MSDSHHVNYKKIYFTLLGLLVVSVAGPFIGIMWVTLVTAFGIALVKAYLVIENFMHLRWEKRIMKWVLSASLIVMALFFAGVSPDVMRHTGRNWVNEAAIAATERGITDHGAEGEIELAEVEPVSAEFTARGTFNVTCALCHGEAGNGEGPTGALLTPPPANFTDPEFWATRDAERIFNSIKNGAASVGGSALMVPWRNSYNDEQIRELAEYVETFRPEGS